MRSIKKITSNPDFIPGSIRLYGLAMASPDLFVSILILLDY
ncbi:MAG: hypothetical protein PF570_09700 [Candidatus Cloacimonetes bacterium]|nr:hypothetical protein [Candidatus Cloacimonadota bacterium]